MYRFTLLGKYSRNPSALVCLLAGVVRCCVQLQWIYFEDFSSTFAHSVMGDLQAHLPILLRVVSSFWPKRHEPPTHTHRVPPSLFTCSWPQWLLFVPLDEKSPQRETFCPCGRGETKNGQSPERHQNQWVKHFFAVEKCLNRCIASNGEHFEGDWSLNVWE